MKAPETRPRSVERCDTRVPFGDTGYTSTNAYDKEYSLSMSQRGRVPEMTPPVTDPYQPMSGGRAAPGPVEGAAQFARRTFRTPETKEFHKTSEFLLYLFAVVALIIAAAVQKNFSAPQCWTMVTALTAVYILSRGIAKSGSRMAEPEGRY